MYFIFYLIPYICLHTLISPLITWFGNVAAVPALNKLTAGWCCCALGPMRLRRWWYWHHGKLTGTRYGSSWQAEVYARQFDLPPLVLPVDQLPPGVLYTYCLCYLPLRSISSKYTRYFHLKSCNPITHITMLLSVVDVKGALIDLLFNTIPVLQPSCVRIPFSITLSICCLIFTTGNISVKNTFHCTTVTFLTYD